MTAPVETTSIVRAEHSHGLPMRMTPDQLREQVEEIKGLMRSVLTENTDYGVIPGTNKPSLYKSGAEWLLKWARLGHRLEPVEVERDDQGRKFGVTYRATVYLLDDPDVVVATCDAYAGYDEDRYYKSTEELEAVERANAARYQRPANPVKWATEYRAPWNSVLKMCLAASTPVLARSERGEYLTELTRLYSWQSRLTSTPVEVPGPDGDWVRVLNVWKNGVQPVLRVRLRDGTEHRVTSEHRFLTERGLVAAGDLTLSDVLVRRSLVLSETKTAHPDFGWLVGLVMADGALTPTGVRITLALNEESLARRAVWVMQQIGCRARYQRRPGMEAWEVVGFGPAIVGLLRQFIAGTAKRKHLAASAWRCGSEFLEGVLQGWLDGDGGLALGDGRAIHWQFGFTGHSDLWARDLRTICAVLGYRLTLRGGLSKANGKTFRTWAGTIKAPTSHGNAAAPSQVVAIDPDGETMTYDLEVASDDHLWCLADGTVTHNSEKRALVGATLQATATSGLFTQDMEDYGAGSTAGHHPAPDDTPDPDAWFVQHGGWENRAEHDSFVTAVKETAAKAPEALREALREWMKTWPSPHDENQRVLTGRAWRRVEADEIIAKMEELSEVAHTTDDGGGGPVAAAGPETPAEGESGPETSQGHTEAGTETAPDPFPPAP